MRKRNLPRRLGKQPPSLKQRGRCCNCNERTGGFRLWCNNLCRLEWQARQAVWLWRQEVAR